jgi:hypothetical protein
MRKALIFLFMAALVSCQSGKGENSSRVIFLHHSTGGAVWRGNTNYYLYKVTQKGDVQKFFSKYNRKNGTNYQISSQVFPKEEIYGWSNFPYDYYNIWVKNAGNDPYLNEPTLEILTDSYDVIIFKHCYPVGDILEDSGAPDIDSEEKRLENYMLQYKALKRKMHDFPDKTFILWTPAARVKNSTTEEKALRTREFYEWIVNEWDEAEDNIYLWDFYAYETEGGLYLKDEYASGPKDSHPNKEFSGNLAPLFGQFIIDCMQGNIE